MVQLFWKTVDKMSSIQLSYDPTILLSYILKRNEKYVHIKHQQLSLFMKAKKVEAIHTPYELKNEYVTSVYIHKYKKIKE